LIEGPADKIRALWDASQITESKDGSLLEAMVPIGEWDYNRAVAAWGTKWDITLEGLNFVENGDGRAMISGGAETAWAPPMTAFQTYVNENPDCYLELKYFEPGMSFIGVWDSEGGDAYWDNVGNLVLENADADDDVLEDLFTHFDVWAWYDTEESEDGEEAIQTQDE
jgi:hypothetical protein